MYYSHSRFAGNKGDLWKHGVLDLMAHCWCKHVRKNFTFLDSHCGSGMYQLQPGGAWKRGLGELTDYQDINFLRSNMDRFHSSMLYGGSFVQLVERYPVNKLVLCDHSAEVHVNLNKLLPTLLQPMQRHVFRMDSFTLLRELREVMDITLVDPAYSLKDGKGNDWEKLPEICQRWSQKPEWLAIWYPIYGPREPERLVKDSQMTGIEVIWPLKRQSPFVPKGCGMLVNESALQQLRAETGYLHRLATSLGCRFVMRQPS